MAATDDFKALLLQSWYKLSDSALEKQLDCDILFRRFIALDISESVPDHSTFWRFRQKLDNLMFMDKLLQEINSQLIDQGLYIKSGGISIVDASVIEAKQCRPKDKDEQSTQNPDVKWNVKAGSDGKSESTYGYKAHINVDVDEDGLIKSIGYTEGNVHDSNCFTELLDGEESSGYADSAYSSKQHSECWMIEILITEALSSKNTI
ncbi:MAG: IS5 family transposase [Candidatus Endonucleobacter bathymodioli]|uniref:IS5 family transposase n=1 Tax=Candidatus Endonucleibacter bathymodioli TaxID=539814 RepID=A0AA90NUL1_9GAMM|nr:IS5 family transposase [Candidatus Endonucleobacter bathymodioli]